MQCMYYEALWLQSRRLWRGLGWPSRLTNRSSFVTIANRTYNDAIDSLNTLQTSFRVLEERRRAGIRQSENVKAEMRAWLKRIGYSTYDLDSLNIVHVAGTKGKGTVCAYINSILSFYQKSHGVPKKIGFYSSPHLVSVRERIRINSEPISASLFTKYFFEVWDLLESSATALSLDPEIKPPYFHYLTLMAFHVFLKEGVGVVVLEVGMGGEYDSTNVVERPAVTGISTIGTDHVFYLGETIDKIAWHKAGIMKSGTPAFTTEQVPKALQMINQRAQEKGVDIKVVEVNPAIKNVNIKPDMDFQRRNASLAIALTSTALKGIDPSFALPERTLLKVFVDGLEQAVWRGRFEIKTDGNICWYLDGAHTAESLNITAAWFSGQSSTLKGIKILIFNQQGRPEAVRLLEGLFRILRSQGLVRFDYVVFCTNTTYSRKGYSRDFLNHTYDAAAIAGLTVQRQFAAQWKSLDPAASISVMPSIEEALEYVNILAKGVEKEAENAVQVLVTGSLHLVGGTLAVLEGATPITGEAALLD